MTTPNGIIAIVIVFFILIVIFIFVMTCIFWCGILIPEGPNDYHMGRSLNHIADETSKVAKTKIISAGLEERSKFDLENENLNSNSHSLVDEGSCRLVFINADDDLFTAEPIAKSDRKYLKSQLAIYRKTLILQAMIKDSINPVGVTATCIKDVHSPGKIMIGSLVVVKRQFESHSHTLKVGDLLQVLRFYVESFRERLEIANSEKVEQNSFFWCTAIFLMSHILSAKCKQDMCFRSRQLPASEHVPLREIPLSFVSVETELQAMRATSDAQLTACLAL